MSVNTRTLAMILMLAVVGQQLPAYAQQGQKLTAFDGAAEDAFGRTVATDGQRIIVGAYKDDDDGEDTGSIYFYVKDGATWAFEQKLTAGDSTPTDRFGWDVDIDGDVAIVGVPADFAVAQRSGSAYIFRYDGASWGLEKKLTASGGILAELFGEGVSISGNVAVVGATGNLGNGSGSGGAYVFRYNGADWVEEKLLLASDGSTSDHFGSQSVSIDGDFEQGAGSAYVFRYDGLDWVEEQKLTGSDTDFQDTFGSAVAIDGDILVVGAPNAMGADVVTGASYVFRFDGAVWAEEKKLFATDGRTSDGFGASVAVSGDVLLVGGSGVDPPFVGESGGAAYVYQHNGADWTLTNQLKPDDLFFDDRFGTVVDVDGMTILVGSPLDDDHGDESGSAYVYDLASLVSVDESLPTNSRGFQVDEVYPNPFHTTTSFSVTTDTPRQVQIHVFDMLGRLVASLPSRAVTPGTHVFNWERGDLPSGLYAVRISTGEDVAETRTVVVR
jgi:hypothetical protein